ncbi:MAG TPA: hypothetical protein VND65_14950 [Candidatus Binatia bacterium]|nr:hypothetical protein [Candidatus Binatia bacterium]
MFRIKIVSSPENIERIGAAGSSRVMEAITAKMNLLMLKLQSKIVGETIPAFFERGAPNIAASVRAIPATTDGTTIRGNVEAGGPKTTKTVLHSGVEVDYAAVQEVGIYHSYRILPFNKKALAFLLNEKLVIVRSVTHPGLKERPFMRYGLQEMETEIIEGLSKTLTEILS